jgi:hypothetical protein
VSKKKIRGLQKGMKLSEAQKEAVVQAYAMCGVYTEVARQLNLSVTTVKKYVSEVPPAEVARIRAQTQLRLAGKVQNKANEILDSISPKDLEEASLQQKSISVGIFVERQKDLIDNYHDLNNNERGRTLMTPDSIQGLLEAIRNKAERISVLQVDFKKDNPELAKRLDALETQAEVLASQPLEVQSIDEFDGFDNQPADPSGTERPVGPAKPS